MKAILSTVLIYCLMITTVFGQASNPSDTYKIGKASSANDKGLIFDTNDGVSNKKLVVEKTSKKLKWDGNSFQFGDGSAASDKEFIFNGDGKIFKYNGTTDQFEMDDHLGFSAGGVKTNSIDAYSGTETAIEQNGRVKGNLKIGTGTNEIRVSGGNLEFSNDGALYKKIGSGSGSGGSGGVQLLENDSFEDGLTPGWTSSGGTFSQQTYTNGSEGDLKYARFVAAGSGEYFQTDLKAIPDNISGGCQADFKKVNLSAAGLFKAEVLDASSNVLATANLNASAWLKMPTLSFVCPAPAATVRLRITSLAAGTIEVDKGYIGSNQGLVSLSQARELGSLAWATTASCTWSTSSSSYADFSADADCDDNARVATGATTSSTTIGNAEGQSPQIKFATMPPGDYEIYAIGYFGDTTASNVSAFRFSDGTTSTSGQVVNSGTTPVVSPVIMGRFSYGVSQSNVTWRIQAKGNTEAATVNAGFEGLQIVVKYYPSVSEIAISNEQSNWFIDVNIGGSASATITGIVSSYTEAIDPGLDMVINPGSATAEIPCSSTNPSTGLTCSAGSESVGVAFTPPMAGRYKVCAYFASNYGTGSAALQLIETPNNAQTIIQEGNSRLFISQTAGSSGDYSPQTNCGYFNFSDTSKRTVRLMGEVNSGNISIVADRGASVGQRDIHIVVENVTFQQNRPILTGDQVTSPGAAKPVHFSFRSSTAGVVTNDIGDLINGNASITATSVYTFAYNSGKITGFANCTCSVDRTAIGSNIVCGIDSSASNQVVVETKIPGTGAAVAGVQVTCDGLAP